MLTGDPIQDDIQWLLQELKQVNEDLEAVMNYYNFIERGNTVSARYDAIDEEAEMSYLKKQLTILNDAKRQIIFELECLDESYLEGPCP
jgi:hypothetical protein